MQKIASPHLAIQLRRLLAYCQGSDKPSREFVARELRLLARQVTDFDMDWRVFQGEYLNPVGRLLNKGKKWGWEEVDAGEMEKELRAKYEKPAPLPPVYRPTSWERLMAD